jgi:predicted RNA polymerase sigma factor
MTASATHRAIEAVWRIESARIIAGLARMVRDVALAEDLAQEALVVALTLRLLGGLSTAEIARAGTGC